MKYLIVLCLLLGGCSNSVYPDEFKTAEKLCESHGGLVYYSISTSIVATRFGISYCNDGTVVDRLNWAEVQNKDNEETE